MTTGRSRGRLTTAGRRWCVLLGLSAAALVLVSAIDTTQDAVANGDTRTIEIIHEHTKESASVTFRRNGQYDAGGLKQLNWLLRDWRLDEPTQMDPRLFDIVWQVYREVGAREPIRVVSAYRSPQTNASLRRRSRAVAEHSQHMLGKAMDFYLPDASMARVREIGMRLQNGGVGFYANAYNPFVHLDAGSVRSWPRMPRPQLARLFPDGRTVHIPKDGKPMAGYEEAKATILARGGAVAGYASYADAGEESSGPRKSLWATLFGGGDDEDSDFYRGQPSGGRQAAAAAPVAAGDDAGGWSFFGSRQPAEAPRAGGRMPVAAASGEGAAAPETAPRAPAPVPPRRPSDLVALAASGAVAPARPDIGMLAGISPPAAPGQRGEMRPGPRPGAIPAPGDDRAALRSLFEAAATPTTPGRRAEVPTSRSRVQPLTTGAVLNEPDPKVRTSFSSVRLDGPPADAFRGPAVAPLRTFR
ncbi:DUF882 domain-containing protein [uncultured Enterovirga sp.]|uniref:DUF882 domain-containing protein n=1 Tax=uncultured Enterovirga sp. TaxID=2026352 RepID=UPI0035CB0B0C